jgi:hypothetical protein
MLRAEDVTTKRRTVFYDFSLEPAHLMREFKGVRPGRNLSGCRAQFSRSSRAPFDFAVTFSAIFFGRKAPAGYA